MSNYVSSTELLKKYPALTHRLHWTKKNLGFFMRNKILTGYYIRNTRTTMILESSLVDLMRFIKQSAPTIESQEENLTETI